MDRLWILGIKTISESLIYLGTVPTSKKRCYYSSDSVPNNWPILLIKHCRESIEAKGLLILHAKQSVLNLIRSGDEGKESVVYVSDRRRDQVT